MADRPYPAGDLTRVDDLTLVRTLAGHREGAWAEFLRRHGDLVYSCTAVVFPGEETDAEYLRVLERLRAGGCALLGDFDGRARMATYLRLKLGDLFADRILGLFAVDAARAWEAFERFFRDDVVRIVTRHLPFASRAQALAGGDGPEDLYQEVCCLLIEQDYRRIRSFDRRGSFAGYVRRVVRNLCTDLARKVEGRRRLPEKILKLPPLEQDVYRLLCWSDASEASLPQLLKDAKGAAYPPQEIDRALAAVYAAGAAADRAARPSSAGLSWQDREGGLHEQDVRDARPSPESLLLEAEQERARDRLAAALGAALERLTPECQLYVRLRFYTVPPKPPREIARLIGRPESEVYRLRDRTLASLRARLAEMGGGVPADVRLST
jgi:RNA polymerase sigma factor (sigma-70 family)